LKPLVIALTIWCVRLAAFGLIVATLLIGVFIAGFGMADNRSALPHLQLLLLVAAVVGVTCFVEAWAERLLRKL